MFPSESSPSSSSSSSSSSYTRSSFDEESEADIEEAKSWLAAQWRLSGVPLLKLKESSYIDTRRWKISESGSIPGVPVGGGSWEDVEKSSRRSDETDGNLGSEVNPVRFTLWRKICLCTSIVLMTGMSLLAYTVTTVITDAIAADFGVSNAILKGLYSSIYLLGIATGVLLVAPLSERYGRLPVYHTSNVGFVITVLTCAQCNDSAALLLLRFASGLFGCSSLVLGGPTIRDIVYAEEQYHNRVLWSVCRLCPLFGYVAAQYGTFIGRVAIEQVEWRDVFRYLGGGAIVVAAASALLLRETYAPVLQATVSQSPGWMTINKRAPSLDFQASQSSLTNSNPLRNHISRRNRPFSAFSPTVILLSLYSTISNCYIYLLYTNLADLFENTYHYSARGIDPAYLGPGSGMAVGLVYLLFLYPHFALSTRVNHDLESLLWLIVPAAFLMPVGILIYGWSLHSGWNSLVPVVATGMIGASVLTTFVPIQIYLIDLFTTKAASALAPSIFLQNVAGTVLPFATTRMLEALGVAWMSSLLGCTALMLLPFPFLFIRYGRSLRERR